MSATELAVEATMDSVGTPSDVLVSLSTERSHYQKQFVFRHTKNEPTADIIRGPLHGSVQRYVTAQAILGVTNCRAACTNKERGHFPNPVPESNIPLTVGL